jgi:inorganic pyrophosphatase
VVVETPKGSRSKYSYDPEVEAFDLSGVLPAGMSFPLDFGFVPQTLGEDGDPLDILILHDEPAAVGAVAEVRLLGVIEAEQTEQGRTFRNDRLIARVSASITYNSATSIDDLGPLFVEHLGRFFINYNELKHKKFKVLRTAGSQRALELIKQSARR